MTNICYAPNAVPIAQYGPCNNDTDIVSLCCSPGQYCLTNGLCATGEGQFYSGACTDDTYKAAICPSFCMGAAKFVVQCRNSAFPDGGFCCDANGSGSCCRDANNALDLATAVTSAMVSPTASLESTTSTSKIQSPSISSTFKTGTLSLATLSTGRTLSSVVNSMGSVIVFDGTSTNSVTSSTTATLVSASPSPSTKPSGHDLSERSKIGLAVGVSFALLIIFAACVLLIVRYWPKSHPESDLKPRRGRKGRVVVSKDSDTKVESVELATNPTRPAELDTNDNAKAPVPAPGLTSSRKNIDRLAALSVRNRAQPEQEQSSAQNSALRPNNPQGPIQMDGASTPPPTPLLTGIARLVGTAASQCTNPSEDIELSDMPTGPVPTWISQLALPDPMDTAYPVSIVSSDGEVPGGNVATYAASSVYSVPTTGVLAPANSAAQYSNVSSLSSGSSKSWDSGQKTVLDVGVVLHTANTESEQGDVSPLSSLDEPYNGNELQEYLHCVGWEPKTEKMGAIVSPPADDMAKGEASMMADLDALAGDSGNGASDSGVEVGLSGSSAGEIAI